MILAKKHFKNVQSTNTSVQSPGFLAPPFVGSPPRKRKTTKKVVKMTQAGMICFDENFFFNCASHWEIQKNLLGFRESFLVIFWEVIFLVIF